MKLGIHRTESAGLWTNGKPRTNRTVGKSLIKAGSNVNTSDKWGYSPLHEAAIKGKADVCIGLLQSGANHNSKNTDGKTPLELAEGSARQVRVKIFSQ